MTSGVADRKKLEERVEKLRAEKKAKQANTSSKPSEVGKSDESDQEKDK